MDDVFEPKSIVVTVGCGFIGSSFAHHAVRECPGTHVMVTRNGQDALIVMTPEAYDGLKSELAHERLMRRLDRAELAFDFGEYLDGHDFLGALPDRCDAKARYFQKRRMGDSQHRPVS